MTDRSIVPWSHGPAVPRRCRGPAALRACAALLLIACVAQGRERFGPIVVNPLSANVGETAHGYFEHRVELENTSETAHEVALTLGSSAQGGNVIRRLTRRMAVPASSRLVLSLPQPPLGMLGDSRLSVRVDGRYRGNVSFPYSPYGHIVGSRGSSLSTRLLVSRSLETDVLDREVNRKKRGSSGRDRVRFVKAEYGTGRWSANWLGYGRFDGVAVSAADMAGMPAPVRAALWRYVACGGCLVVEGEVAPPEPWRQMATERVAGGPGARQGFRRVCVGFGECVMSAGTPLNRLSGGERELMRKALARSLQPWSQASDRAAANRNFPVVENLATPIRALFIVIVAFTILIGPANLLVLRRLRRQIWMLWTIPAISLAGTLIIVLYAVFSEGITPTARIETVSLLDQVGHRATTVGLAAYYCPVTPRRGLHYGYDTEVTPQVSRRAYGSGNARVVDWTRDQHLGSGWIRPRVPAHFMLRKTEPCRRRLDLDWDTARAASVLNGLGTEIRRLWLADATGRIWTAAAIAPGEKARLTAREPAVHGTGDLGRLRGLFAAGAWAKLIEQLTAKGAAGKYLFPGTYIAELSDTPLLERGLAGRLRGTRRAVVFGVLDRAGVQ